MATVSDDGTVGLWSLEAGEAERIFDPGAGPLRRVAFHPDGERIAIGCADGSIRVWNPDEGEDLIVSRGHAEETTALVYSDDGSRLYSGSRDGTVRTWETATGTELRSLGCGAEVVDVALDESSDLLVVATTDFSIKRFQLSSSIELGRVSSPTGAVQPVVLSDDGALGAVSCRDRVARVFETGFGTVIGELRGYVESPGDIWTADFSADGFRMVTGSWGREVYLWDVSGNPAGMRVLAHGGARPGRGGR